MLGPEWSDITKYHSEDLLISLTSDINNKYAKVFS